MVAPVSWMILLLLAPASACLGATPTNKTTTSHILHLVDPKADANLFIWSDTCNVYVVRDGEAALLIDLVGRVVSGNSNDVQATAVWLLA